ncbi:hypothetical protein HYDPIDRAFT_23710 [Hydnomerulius pinastri MD-312]|nr:hypothetical protein HYDPIDRAFT_23710 [Hydnomerulius pinastri MD-312]
MSYYAYEGVGPNLNLPAQADGRGWTSPDSASVTSGEGAITPAQAIARAYKTGQNHDRALHFTIERKQPEKETQPHSPPSQLNNPASERGASFARRLYASAVGNKSSTSLLSASSISPAPPDNHAPPSLIIPTGRGRPPPFRGPQQHRNTSRSPSLLDTGSEATQAFSPADFYHSSVARHGFPSRSSASPEAIARRPHSLMPVSQPSSPPLSAPPVPYPPSLAAFSPPNLRASYSQSHLSLSEHEIAPRSRPISPDQTQRTSAPPEWAVQVPSRGHDGRIVQEAMPPPPIPSIETAPPDVPFLHPIDAAEAASRSPSPYVQPLVVIPPSPSPPPFGGHEVSPVRAEEVAAAADAPALSPPPAPTSHEEEIRHARSFSLPLEAGHEYVPQYCLLDESHPPPAFDDVHSAGDTVLSTDVSSVAPTESSSSATGPPGAPSRGASPPPPPFPHKISPYLLEKAPSYALLDPARSTSAGPSTYRVDVKVSPPPLTQRDTRRASGSFLPGPSGSFVPSTMPLINSKRMSVSPPGSPPMAPPNAAPLYGTAFPSTLPARPSSSSRPPSVISSRSVDSQPKRLSLDYPPYPSHSMSLPLPPPPLPHTRPASQQGRYATLPATIAMQSAQEHPHAFGVERDTTSRSFRHVEPSGSVGLSSVTEDYSMNGLTHAMTSLMGGIPSRTSFGERIPAYEDLSAGQSYLGTTLPEKKREDIYGSHPSGASQTAVAQNQAMYGPGAEGLLQEAYQLFHKANGGETSAAILGSSSVPGSTQGTWSEYSGSLHGSDPCTAIPSDFRQAPSYEQMPHAHPVPQLGSPTPSFSHAEPLIDSARVTESGSLLSQFSGTVAGAPPTSHADRPHTAYVRSSLYSPSSAISQQEYLHYSVDPDVHRTAGFQGLYAPGEQTVHPPSQYSVMPTLDTVQGRGSVAPPPPPIALQTSHTSQTPQTSLYSQDSTKYQVGPSAGGAASNSNEIARRFARDALMLGRQ